MKLLKDGMRDSRQRGATHRACTGERGAGCVQRVSGSSRPSRLQRSFHKEALAGESNCEKNYAKACSRVFTNKIAGKML